MRIIAVGWTVNLDMGEIGKRQKGKKAGFKMGGMGTVLCCQGCDLGSVWNGGWVGMCMQTGFWRMEHGHAVTNFLYSTTYVEDFLTFF